MLSFFIRKQVDGEERKANLNFKALAEKGGEEDGQDSKKN